MQRSLRSRLTRPRHVLATALVVILCAGSAGGIIGFAAAGGDSDSPAAKSTFSLTSPNVGDRGRYDLVEQPGASDSILPFGAKDIEFQWLPDVATYDMEGRGIWANQVRLRTNYSEIDGGRLHDHIYLLRAGTGQAFAMTRAADGVRETDSGAVARDVSTQTDWLANRPLVCGFLSLLQGQEIQLTALTMEDTMACASNDPVGGNLVTDGSLNPYAIKLSGYQEQDGHRYIMVDEFSMKCGCPERHHYYRYFYREDIPYPVRIEGRDDSSALVLSGFERGGTPAHRSEEGAGLPPVPGLAFAPRQPWGLDDKGVEHAFPLSTAYQLARDDASYTGLRDFLADHPDAYTAFAVYQDIHDKGTLRMFWSFTVTDGSVMLRVTVERRTADPTTPSWPIPLPPPVPPPPVPLPGAPAATPGTDDFSDAGVEDASGQRYAPPGALPDSLPTVASMIARWQAYASPDYRTQSANYWRLDLSCSFDCPLMDRIVSAGWTTYNRTYPNGADQPPVDRHLESSFGWRETDFPDREGSVQTVTSASLYETRTEWRHDGKTPTVAAAPSSMDGLSGTMPLVLAGVWAMPGSAAASAVSLGSLLAGAAYYFWPALKTGGIGLFSRIKGDALLENPLRSRIVALVEAQPGIHYSDLVRKTGKGHGAVEHHIRKLVAGGLVRRIEAKGYTCFFPEGATDRRTMHAASVLKSPVARGLVAHLRETPGMSSADAARLLGVTPPTLHYHVQRLSEAGLVRSTSAGATRRLELTPDGQVAVT